MTADPRKESATEAKLKAFHEESGLGRAYDLRLVRRLWPFVTPHWVWVAVSLGTLLLISALNLARPLLMGEVVRRAAGFAAAADYPRQLAPKRARRIEDEAAKPLAAYRAEELAQMRRNFYGFDPSYHYARHHFVHKLPHAWTPRHLARHRDQGATPARAA